MNRQVFDSQIPCFQAGAPLSMLIPKIALAALLLVYATASVSAQPTSSTNTRAAMTTIAKGTFAVKLLPLTFEGQAEGTKLARMSIDKEIAGDLVATTQGQMLSARTEVKGSAGYVALERVEGALHGRKGSFVFQHTGTMNKGTPSLSVTVVPDSGTGELVGLMGDLKIIIADGKHSYVFEYKLP